jgi:hypothetical protein
MLETDITIAGACHMVHYHRDSTYMHRDSASAQNDASPGSPHNMESLVQSARYFLNVQAILVPQGREEAPLRASHPHVVQECKTGM